MQHLRPLGWRVDQHIGRGVNEGLRTEAKYAADRPRAGVAGRLDVYLAVADHDGLLRRGAGFFHQRAQAKGIGLLYGEAVAPIDMEEVVGQAQPLADAARRIHGLVGEHGHDSRGAAGRVVQLVQRLQRVENAFVGIGEVQLVLAVVLQEKLVGLGEELLIDCVREMLPAMASERRMSMGAPLPTKPAIAGSGSGPRLNS